MKSKRPVLKGSLWDEHNYNAAYYWLYRRCIEAGDDPEKWTQQQVAECCILASHLAAPPRSAPRKFMERMARLKQKYHAESWPSETHQRQALLTRMIARIRCELEFDHADPDELIMRPLDEDGWNRLIDHRIALERKKS